MGRGKEDEDEGMEGTKTKSKNREGKRGRMREERIYEGRMNEWKG